MATRSRSLRPELAALRVAVQLITITSSLSLRPQTHLSGGRGGEACAGRPFPATSGCPDLPQNLRVPTQGALGATTASSPLCPVPRPNSCCHGLGRSHTWCLHRRATAVGSSREAKISSLSLWATFHSCGKRGGSHTQHVFQGASNSNGPGANFLLLNHKLFLASAQLQKSHKKSQTSRRRKMKALCHRCHRVGHPDRVTLGDFPKRHRKAEGRAPQSAGTHGPPWGQTWLCGDTATVT